jgi:CRP-like cAMP-binding protein
MNKEELTALKDIIGRTDFIHLIPESALERHLGRFYPISFTDGELIFREGKSAGAFLIVAEGKLDIYITDEKGRENKIKTLQAVDYVGETALLSGDVRNATVKAHDGVKAYILGKAAFDNLLEEIPAVKEFLLEVAERRKKDTSKRAESSKTRSEKLPAGGEPIALEKEQVLLGPGDAPSLTGILSSGGNDNGKESRFV